MKLWSEYEGSTIAEDYPLKKLVRPEGRSAFFLTTNGTGTPALVRIIEAHFDEPEILSRWRRVADLGSDSLLTMRRFGQTQLDGTPLVYAVMEPTEISLEELLANRTLTAEEARELGYTLVEALETLHAGKLAHTQVAPENILVAGEHIKLRSDCVRDLPSEPVSDGASADELKAQDVQAVAQVLLLGLTGRATLQGSATTLPTPFDGIIRNGLSGRWGLKEMSAALGPRPRPVPPPEPIVAPVVAAATVATVAPETGASAVPSTEVEAAPASTEAAKVVPPVAAPAATTPPVTPAASLVAATAPLVQPKPAAQSRPAAASAQQNLFSSPAPANAATSAAQVAAALPQPKTPAPDVRHRLGAVSEEPASLLQRKGVLVAIAAAILLVLIFGWRMMRSDTGAPKGGSQAAVAAPATAEAAPAPSKPSAARTGNVPARRPAPAPAAAPASPAHAASAPVVTAGSGPKTVWRVVAFTYNRRDQAEQKAAAIQKQHPNLRPEVFSVTGGAPFLVTLGGGMSHDQAASLRGRAHGEGLPRDTYIQNYSR